MYYKERTRTNIILTLNLGEPLCINKNYILNEKSTLDIVKNEVFYNDVRI